MLFWSVEESKGASEHLARLNGVKRTLLRLFMERLGRAKPTMRNPTKPPNIASIAEAAGVSPMTVSRALKDHPSVAEQTRIKIQAIARQMNYVPNLLVGGIMWGRTRTIGLIISPGRYYSSVIRGVHDELALHNYAMILSCDSDPISKPVPAIHEAHVRRLVERRVDGIILRLPDSTAPADYLEELRDRNIPLVLLDQPLADKRLPVVESENFDGARQIGVVAWEMGHRHLAFVGGPSHLTQGQERLRGFMSPFKESGDPFHVHKISAVDWAFSVGVGLDILTRNPRPTVVFCVADDAAPAIYEAASRLRLRIPEDVSVVGFGNLDICRVMTPPLASVEQFPQDVGRVAARTLLDILRFSSSDKKVPQQVHRMPTEFILRGSMARVSGV